MTPRKLTLQALSFLANSTLLSCIGPLTEVWVVVESNIPIAAQNAPGFAQVRVQASVGGAQFWDTPYSLQDGAHALPGHFVLRPTSADETRPIELIAEAQSSAGMGIVRQRAVFTFSRGRRQVLRLYLAGECAGQRQLDCEAIGQTCTQGGICIEVQRGMLQDYYPDAIQPTADVSSPTDGPLPMDASESDASQLDASPPIDGTSNLAAPRLIAPLSGSVMSTNSTVIRWELPMGVTGAVLEVSHDRSFTNAAMTNRYVQGVNTQTDTLSPGTYYFRIRGWNGDLPGSAVSPTWQMRVPRMAMAGAVDNAIRTEPDYNGDGFADIAHSITPMGGTRMLNIEFGATRPSGGPPLATIVANPNFLSPQMVGDVNGDGFVDLAVAAPGSRAILVFLGGTDSTNILLNSVIISAPAAALSDFGALITSAGDVNGDGYADFLIGAGLGPRQTPQTYLQLGAPGAMPNFPARMLLFTGASSALGGAGMSAGDMDGNGRSELAIAQPYIDNPMAPGSRSGVIDIYQWPAMMAAPIMAARLLMSPEQPNQKFGLALSLHGDNNGDGRADLLANADGYTNMGSTAGAIGWKAGSAGVPSPLVPLLRAGTLALPLGRNLAQIGDLNSDGFGEIAATEGPQANPSSRVLIFGGSAGGPIMNAPVMTIAGDPMITSSVGSIITGVGDFNGDNFDDFVCPQIAASAPMSAIQLYFGAIGYPLTSRTIATGTIDGIAGSQ